MVHEVIHPSSGAGSVEASPSMPSCPSGPRLSVVIATDTFETVRRVLESFSRQQDPSLLEMILVAPPGGLSRIDGSLLARFGRVQRVEVPEVQHLARSNAAGVAAATCPFICLGETHCFPAPGWTEALLAAHATGATAVLCAIDNLRPDKLLDTAGYALDYARIGSHHASGPRPSGLGHNTSYRCEYLRALGPQLPISLDYFSEQAHPLFAGLGGTLVFAPDAVAHHASVGGGFHAAFYRFIVGLKLGGSRRRRWPLLRCCLCFLATPVLPFLIVWRERAHGVGIPDLRFPRPLLLGTMLWLSLFKCLGEAVGLVFGTPAWARATEPAMETRRLDFGHGSEPVAVEPRR